MKLIRFIFAMFLFGSLFGYQAARAQLVAYSQYNNTPLLTNPARASLTDYTQISFHYRWSRVANYQIPSVSFVLPFYRQANGLRYGGMGINVISQQAGPGGLYKVTGATGTFAYTIHLSRRNHIAAGLGGGIINKRIDASGITTDSQFNFGAYDPSLANGENFQSNAVTRPVINTGFCWVLTGDDDREKASLGVAAYNVNRPSFGLLENASKEKVTYVAAGELEILKRGRLSVLPTFRYIYDGASMANLGARVSYAAGHNEGVLSAGVWYKTTGAMVAAAQYNHKSYVLAASMDFSTAADLDVNINNAFEISLGWRLNRKERKRPRNTTSATVPVAVTPTREPVAAEGTTPVAGQPPAGSPQEPEAAGYEQATGSTGTDLTEEERQLSATLIHFELGSDSVSAESDAFFDELAETLINHPDYKLKITGHSCKLGDKGVNEEISYERADAVAQRLMEKGVPQDRLLVIGMDFQQPIAPNDTEAGRQKNRRVEFEWIKK